MRTAVSSMSSRPPLMRLAKVPTLWAALLAVLFLVLNMLRLPSNSFMLCPGTYYVAQSWIPPEKLLPCNRLPVSKLANQATLPYQTCICCRSACFSPGPAILGTMFRQITSHKRSLNRYQYVRQGHQTFTPRRSSRLALLSPE